MGRRVDGDTVIGCDWGKSAFYSALRKNASGTSTSVPLVPGPGQRAVWPTGHRPGRGRAPRGTRCRAHKLPPRSQPTLSPVSPGLCPTRPTRPWGRLPHGASLRSRLDAPPCAPSHVARCPPPPAPLPCASGGHSVLARPSAVSQRDRLRGDPRDAGIDAERAGRVRNLSCPAKPPPLVTMEGLSERLPGGPHREMRLTTAAKPTRAAVTAKVLWMPRLL